MIRLICIDVDGTLVGSSGTVLPETWAAAERVRASGIPLAVCSGRPAFGVTRALATRLDPGGWHVFQNGASLLHLPSDRSLSECMDPAIVADLVARSRASGRILELYADAEYAVESTSERASTHARLLGVPFAPRPLDSIEAGVVRAQWLVDIDAADRVLAEPHDGLEISMSTSPLMPDTAFLNMTPAGVNKGTAVRRIAQAYGVALDEVMFVGDGHNDLGAMREVGFPVAMANAEPEVIAIARRAVGHVDEGGLAEALEMALSLAAA